MDYFFFIIKKKRIFWGANFPNYTSALGASYIYNVAYERHDDDVGDDDFDCKKDQVYSSFILSLRFFYFKKCLNEGKNVRSAREYVYNEEKYATSSSLAQSWCSSGASAVLDWHS